MDIDAQRAKLTSTTCHRCGEVGHLRQDCPRRFDVRHMTIEEREDLLESLLAAKDAIPSEETPNTPEEMAGEDFVPRSG